MSILEQVRKTWATALRFEKALIILAGAAGLTALLVNLDFNLLEANLYDLRMSRGVQPDPDSNIVLVALDDRTTKTLNEFTPLSMDLHVKFLEAVEKADLKAIGYLVDFNRVDQLNPGVSSRELAEKFVEIANRIESRGTTFILGTPFDVTGEVLPPFPLSSLTHSVAVIHRDGNVFAEDKITRRALVQMNEKPVFHTQLAQKLGYLYPGETPRGTFYVPEADTSYFFFRYHGTTVLANQPKLAKKYPMFSFLDILEGKVDPAALRGKILLVGSLSNDDPGDYAFTPYSKASKTNPKLLVHADILDSILHNEGVARAPGWVNWAVTFAVTAFVLWWVMNSTPLYGVFATLSLVLLVITFGQALFQLRGLWIRESQPLVGIFIGYYVVVPYRLIREYKKRWDYQRKNELLTQVEELKRNFLSLVTHDLKTPVARIQGLAEVVLRRSTALASSERESLQHIIQSTEELNRFISSILELSKVESDRMNLVLESKDPNQLIERVLEGFQAQAYARQIAISAELEPMFPIRLDAGMISKVLNNLIDNAIKYSPPHSRVVVQSREVIVAGRTFLEISVRDNGIGLTSEEMANLFTRFYRAKNDVTTRVSGTGLGLYLTKYFVEAHQGTVQVQSEKGVWTCFQIRLPMDLTESAPTPTPPPLAVDSGSGFGLGLKRRLKFSLSSAEANVAEADVETQDTGKKENANV